MDEAEQAPPAFLSGLAQRLRGREGADPDLADILGLHLLTAQPPKDAAGDAHKAIVALAARRAALPKGGADD